MRITLLFFLICPSLTFAQESNPFPGEWRGDWDLTISRADDLTKQEYDSAETPFQNHIRGGIETKEFTFNADGSMALSWEGAHGRINSSGAWSYDPALKRLRLTINSSSREYEISILNNNTIVAKILNSPSTLLFNEIVYVRK